MKKTIFLQLLMLIFAYSVHAQNQLELLVHYDTKQFEIPEQYKSKLLNLADSIATFDSYTISIEGYTDNEGTSDFNKELSKNRAEGVKTFLVENHIQADKISVDFFGATNFIADNGTEAGKQKNRRVKLLVSYETNPKPKLSKKIATDNTKELYAKTDKAFETFKINNRKDTIVRTKSGTLILVQANSFDITDSVEIRFKSFFNQSDMLAANLNTMSDRELLVTGGMFFVEAFKNDSALNLKKGKSINFFVPDKGGDNQYAQAYTGQHNGYDNQLNWSLSGNSSIDRISAMDRFGCYWLYTDFFERCGLFCKLGNFFDRLFGKNTPEDIFYEANNFVPYCNEVKRLLLAYGIEDFYAFYNASNKDILDHYGVSNSNELKEELEKRKKKKYEENYASGQMSFQELQNYVYRSEDYMLFRANQTGWHNIDTPIDRVMAEAPNRSDIRIRLETYDKADVRLVFNEYTSIMLPERDAEDYVFIGVPENMNISVVAISYENGKPLLDTRDIISGEANYTMKMKHYSIDEFKSKLSALDMI